VKVSSRADQFLVGGVVNAIVMWLKVGGEGALGGMLRFFLVVSPECSWSWDSFEKVCG
jgi:hypothetical protein